MKKIICLMCLCVMMCGAAGAVSAQAACLIDADTGDVLFEQNADARLPMASTTKIMTALVALSDGNLDRTYKVKKEYTLVEGSSMYLQEGEEITLRDTLYGLMPVSYTHLDVYKRQALGALSQPRFAPLGESTCDAVSGSDVESSRRLLRLGTGRGWCDVPLLHGKRQASRST